MGNPIEIRKRIDVHTLVADQVSIWSHAERSDGAERCQKCCKMFEAIWVRQQREQHVRHPQNQLEHIADAAL